MPYYGDYYAGDPGLFSFLKKIKLGRIVGGIVKQAFPAIAGAYSGVQAIREQGALVSKDAATGKVLKSATVASAPVLGRRIRKTGAKVVRGKAISPFAQRMAKARLAAARARAGS